MSSKPKFCLKTVGDEVIFTSNESQKPIDLPISVTLNENKSRIRIDVDCFKQFDQFFSVLNADILSMKVTEKNRNIIYCALMQIVENYDCMLAKMMPNRLKDDYTEIASSAKQFVIEKLTSRDSTKKRRKLIESDPGFVKPVKSAIGLKWSSQSKCGNELIHHKIEQTTFQYIPISDTLKALFTDKQFSESYFDFNKNRKHTCTEDVFEDFCCGSIFKENPVFTPTTILLQLGIDEYEPLNALKTKKGLHKMCGVYLEIRNLDPEIKSKLIQTHLVAIAKSQDIKFGNGLDKIARRIVDELKSLETTGIIINCDSNLKAILINISSDNLGANGLFGFVECFVANYFCRMCELTSVECKTTVEEVAGKMRQKPDYVSILETLNDGEYSDPKQNNIKGIKKSCIFNELNHFHILANCCVDVMHDVNEGVIPF